MGIAREQLGSNSLYGVSQHLPLFKPFLFENGTYLTNASASSVMTVLASLVVFIFCRKLELEF